VAQWKAEFPDTIARIAPGWLENHADLAARHAGAADAAGLAIARAWVSLIEFIIEEAITFACRHLFAFAGRHRTASHAEACDS
ncbi:hypothetical protein ACCS53_38700, partial [Rhizobium ruizarguesonis]